MMVIVEATAVSRTLSSLLQLLGTVQSLGNNYYKASAAWDMFPRQVILLCAKQAALETHLDRYGEDPEPSFLALLENAKQLLQEEESRLRRRDASEKSCGCIFSGRVGEMFFPDKVGQSIQNVIGAYDDIEAQMKAMQEGDQMARDSIKNKPICLSFSKRSQKNYVPLGCEEKVYSALKESGETCPRVVLLYGGPGTGKTTVVTQVSLSFEKDKSTFDQVVFLRCGTTASLQGKEVQLLLKLGWDEASELTEKYSNQDVRTGRLQNLLKNRKLLIVLDDLWESQLLQRLLILSGPRVKYLVSSQRKDLCKNLDDRFNAIQIDDLQQNDAEKILAIHVGFRDDLIPDDSELKVKFHVS